MTNRVVLIILDSLGLGALPDAAQYKDEGAATLPHIYEHRGYLNIPNLCSLGLGEIAAIGCDSVDPVGSFGKMMSQSPNKDTTSGHWEITGVVMNSAFPTYPDGFPEDIIKSFEEKIGRTVLGNTARSGTVILDELGPAHLETGQPIVYTSADSVFQIAAHEAVIPLETLYQYCQIARGILKGEHSVARVIARPFKGRPGSFERINNHRKDYSMEPPAETLLDSLYKKGLFTVGIGKIGDIFGHRGLSEEIHSRDNSHGIALTYDSLQRYRDQRGLIFVNLVDFDMVYGHRRNIEGYALALEAFDAGLPDIMYGLTEQDILIITADHGCDPTFMTHTDHTREYVPLLVYGQKVVKGFHLGIRPTFADCGQTICDVLSGDRLQNGTSFKDEIFSG